MSDYQAVYEQRFVENLKRYTGIKDKVNRRVKRVLRDPYANTELLVDISGKLNLRGCRSARVDRNFRLIYVICGECRSILECVFCFCDDLPDNTIVFLTVGPHDRAYAMR